MRLLTRFELASKSTGELHALYRDAFNALARSTRDSAERRNSLASLENIESELATRLHPS